VSIMCIQTVSKKYPIPPPRKQNIVTGGNNLQNKKYTLNHPEPMICWGIVSPMSKYPFIIGKVFFTRKDAQDDISKVHGMSWKQLYRKGFRTIRVIISPYGVTYP